MVSQNNLWWLVLLILVATGCQTQAQNGELKVLKTANEVIELIQGSNIQIVDVRTPAEYNEGHIKGAILINIGEPDFKTKMDALDKNQPVLIYCAVGGRSTRASKQVETLGFKAIYNYLGGMNDWLARGMEIEK